MRFRPAANREPPHVMATAAVAVDAVADATANAAMKTATANSPRKTAIIAPLRCKNPSKTPSKIPRKTPRVNPPWRTPMARAIMPVLVKNALGGNA